MARIAIVDDNADIRDLIAMVLEGAGHEVVMAADGAAGLELVMSARPDLMVLDVMMPRMSGIDAVRDLRSNPDYADVRHMPVVMLTAKSRLEDEDQGTDSGADVYLTKPFSPRDLRAKVAALLGRD